MGLWSSVNEKGAFKRNAKSPHPDDKVKNWTIEYGFTSDHEAYEKAKREGKRTRTRTYKTQYRGTRQEAYDHAQDMRRNTRLYYWVGLPK